MEKHYYVYILSNMKHGTLYVGFTGNLLQRVLSHKEGRCEFTAKYGATKLVHFEVTNDVNAARARERRLKDWKREWKIELIEERNPEWNDLFGELTKL